MNNIDWKAFETNISLMLINMKLESLPTGQIWKNLLIRVMNWQIMQRKT